MMKVNTSMLLPQSPNPENQNISLGGVLITVILLGFSVSLQRVQLTTTDQEIQPWVYSDLLTLMDRY